MPPAGRQVETITDVLETLDAIIADAMEEGSRVGYFAAIYRKMTAKVAEGIEARFFDDGERMERLDVVFADRYLQAYEAFRAGGSATRSWARAFEATASARPLKHLLMGINAHINLDLGIAAAEIAPGPALPDLRRDFDRDNEIIASLMGEVASDLAAVSPWIGLLDRLGGRHDDEVIRFSIESARSAAWRFAVELAPLAREDWGGPIGARDSSVARLGGIVLNPGWLSLGLLVIRARESTDVRRVIDVLNAVEGPDLGVVEARVRQERAPSD
jgi:Family of unknown function (DUF5995)